MQVSYHRGMLKVSIIFLLAIFQGFLFLHVQEPRELQVSFLDVGQGDAIYIRAPNGNDMLIDGGGSERVLRALTAVMPVTDKAFDVVIATHPDKDHIGGLVFVLERYHVGYFLDPGVPNDTLVYRELSKQVAENTNYVVARKGMKIYLSEDVIVDVLFPDREMQGDTNNASVITRISYGETAVLLTGDAGKGVERALLKGVVESDLLKVGHHGSKTSSDEIFLKTVSPEYAIISAGKNNTYGHPHASVISTLESVGAKILETADEGTITFISDGKSFIKK